MNQQPTPIGHRVREAAQAFATAMIDRYGADDPAADVTAVKKRLGAVIDRNRMALGEKAPKGA